MPETPSHPEEYQPEAAPEGTDRARERSAPNLSGRPPDEQLSGSSTLLRQLVEHLPTGTVFVDGDQLHMNRVAEEMTGYRREELQTLDAWFAALYGEQQAEIRELYESHRDTGFAKPATVQLRRKDGEARVVEFAAYRFNGCEVWSMYDVTERVRTETALRESKDQLRAVVDTAVEAIITIDRKGIVQTFNRSGERMFGYEAAEVIGRNVKMLMPSPYHEEHDGYLERYLRTGVARIIGIGREVVGRRKDGSMFPIELAVGEGRDGQLFTGVIRDVSERKESEERLRQADRLSSIGTLAAGLGHDMNNMLLPVRARLDVIERAQLPPNVREQFVEIRKSAKYLQDLADGLHLLALDPEDHEASTQTTDLDEWWTQTHTLLARALPKHARFSASLSSHLPPISVAPHRLTQAVLNLLVNSSKAVGQDGRVRLWAAADIDRQAVRLGVTDNGCGMANEVRRRALEPFFTTKKRGLGTGLGLSLVHGVVTAAGGTVEIESAPGEGATITLTFPTVAASHSDRTPSGDDDTPIQAVVSVRDRRIESLIVNLLEMAGAEVDMTTTADIPDAHIWVTDDADAAHEVLGERGAENRHVVLIGSVGTIRHEPNVHVIDNPTDFDSLRSVISRVIDGASA